MELTSLPTENLYKFLAFAGLLILTVFVSYLYKMYVQLNEKLIKAEEEADIVGLRIDNYKSIMNLKESELEIKMRSFDCLKKDYENANDILKKQNLNIDEIEEKFLELTKNVIDNHVNLRDNILQIDIAQAKSKSSLRHVNFLHNQLAIIKRVRYFVIVLGLAMSLIGFYRWYNIQQYIDSSIKKGALK